MSLMDDNGELKEDLALKDDDIGKQIREMFDDGKDLQITVQAAVGQEMAIAVKESA